MRWNITVLARQIFLDSDSTSNNGFSIKNDSRDGGGSAQRGQQDEPQ